MLDDVTAEALQSEVIVVDGGSRDGTANIAHDRGTKVLSMPPGRGVQLCAGASAATGNVLLFLHADCRFPAGGLERLSETLAAHPTVIGGNFRLLFDGPDRFSRWLEGFYAWIRSHGVYYGDSGIFIRRDALEAIGGVRPIALMEDFDLVRRMERHGETVCIPEPSLVTSSRRFRGRHPVAIVYGWLKIHVLYYLGVSPACLARLYDSERRADHSPTTATAASVRRNSSGSSITKGGIR